MNDATSTNVSRAVPMFLVKDMRAALGFYVKGLGCSVKHHWTPEAPEQIRWCWLELGTAALMLQELSPEHAQVDVVRGVGVSICFMCSDALPIYHAALAKGLTPQRPFVGNGLWVVSFTDPDGYRIDFESPTDVPEETEYDPLLHS